MGGTYSDVKVEFSRVELVLGNRQPSYAVLVTSAKDHWRPVSEATVGLAPHATILEGCSLGVDVVLCRGRLTLPSIRSSGDGASQFEGRARGRVEWDDHVLGSWRLISKVQTKIWAS